MLDPCIAQHCHSYSQQEETTKTHRSENLPAGKDCLQIFFYPEAYLGRYQR